SAMRSSSAVVTPGRRAASMRANASARTRPAVRIRSISARDLRVTISGRVALCVERPDERGLDLVDGQAPVDGDQHAVLPVVVDDFLERWDLGRHPGADGLLAVVIAVDERRAVDVADAGHVRRV